MMGLKPSSFTLKVSNPRFGYLTREANRVSVDEKSSNDEVQNVAFEARRLGHDAFWSDVAAFFINAEASEPQRRY